MALRATLPKVMGKKAKATANRTFSKLRRGARASAQGESRSRVPPTLATSI